MAKFREKPNDEDTLLYVNKDYLIFRKDGETVGTLDAPIDLVLIGLDGLPDYLGLLAEKEAKLNILRHLNQDLIDIQTKVLEGEI